MTFTRSSASQVPHGDAGPTAASVFGDALRSQISIESVPSGILHQLPPKWSVLSQLGGSADALSISDAQWRQTYFELQCGATTAAALGTLPDAESIADGYWRQGFVPLMIAVVDHEALRNRFWVRFARVASGADVGDVASVTASDIVESRRACFACALLEREYDGFSPIASEHLGRRVTFVLPTRTTVGNVRGVTKVEADFGDGSGRRQLEPQRPVVVEYATGGAKQLSIFLTLENGEELTGHQTFAVRSPQMAEPPSRSITATIQHPGDELASGTAWIFYGKENGVERNVVKRPVLFAEGFPGGEKWDKLYERVNQFQLADKIREAGQDLILLTYANGARPIQSNAYMALEAIRQFLAEPTRTHPMVVGGGSMGGLVTRYALLKREALTPDDNVSKYFSVDTPHLGANVPAALGAWVNFMGARLADAAAAAALFATPAAGQMLYVRVPLYATWKDNTRNTLSLNDGLATFMSELKSMGDAPKRSKSCAIACGDGTGKPSPGAPGSLALWYECTFDYWAEMQSYDFGDDRRLARFRDKQVKPNTVYEWVSGTGTGRGYDTAPGGTAGWFTTVWAALPIPDGTQKRLYMPQVCFVPTVSALGIQKLSGEKQLYTRIEPGFESLFDQVYFPESGNLPHVVLNDQLATVLYSFIARS